LDGDTDCDPSNTINKLKTSTDFTILVIQTSANTCIYNLVSGNYVFSQKISSPTSTNFLSLELSSDGKRIILGTNNGDGLNKAALVYDLSVSTYTKTQ
jgi:hypothetical protein